MADQDNGLIGAGWERLKNQVLGGAGVVAGAAMAVPKGIVSGAEDFLKSGARLSAMSRGDVTPYLPTGTGPTPTIAGDLFSIAGPAAIPVTGGLSLLGAPVAKSYSNNLDRRHVETTQKALSEGRTPDYTDRAGDVANAAIDTIDDVSGFKKLRTGLAAEPGKTINPETGRPFTAFELGQARGEGAMQLYLTGAGVTSAGAHLLGKSMRAADNVRPADMAPIKGNAQIAAELAEKKGLKPEQVRADTTTPTGPVERNRADATPLSDDGRVQVSQVGRDLAVQAEKAGKGGAAPVFDRVISSRIDRAKETANAVVDHVGGAVETNPDLDPWVHGMEGVPTADSQAEINRLMTINPDEVPTHGSPYLERPAESYNSYKNRFLPELRDLMDAHETPTAKGGIDRSLIVGHGSDLRTIEAWGKNGFGGDLTVDPEALKATPEQPGGMLHMYQEKPGVWQVEPWDPKTDTPLEKGIYLLRHGDTPWSGEAPPVDPVAKENFSKPPASPVFSNVPSDPVTGESAADKFDLTQRLKASLTLPEQASIYNDMLNSKSGMQALLDWSKARARAKDPDTRLVSQVVHDWIADGHLSEDVTNRLASTYELPPDASIKTISDMFGQMIRMDQGMKDEQAAAFLRKLPPEQARAAASAALKSTTSGAGTALSMLSDIVQDHLAAHLKAESEGVPGAAENALALQRIRNAMQGNTPYTLMDKMLQWFKMGVIMPPSTQLKIARSSILGNGLNEFFSNIVSGTVESAMGNRMRAMGEGDPSTMNMPRAFGDLAALIGSVVMHAQRVGSVLKNSIPGVTDSPIEPTPLERFLDSAPLRKLDFNRGVDLDVGGEMLKNKMIAKDSPNAQKVMSGMDHIMNYATAGHRFTSWFTRNLFAQARLQSNLEALGTTPEALMKKLNEDPKGLSDVEKSAVDDAFAHGFKQNMNYVPSVGFVKNVLDVYKSINKLPVVGKPLAAMTNLFPRFWMNNLRWQVEHSPAGLVNLFSKDFRDQLAQGGLPGRQAARMIGNATTGLLRMNAALALHDTGLVGPKYYQVQVGEDKTSGEKTFYDIRGDIPMKKAMFVTALLKTQAEGRPMNLTPNEFLDGLFDMQTSDVPLTLFDELSKEATNPSDEDSFRKRAEGILGKFIAAGFRPAKELEKLYGTIHPAALLQRDSKDSPFLGPIISSIPGAAETMPLSIDPITGPRKIDHPIAAFAGLNLQNVDRLRRTIDAIPDFTNTKIRGNWGNPTADRLMNEHIAQILDAPDPNSEVRGESIGDRIARLAEAIPGWASADPRWKEQYLNNKNFKDENGNPIIGAGMLAYVRDAAHDNAVRENPIAFLEHYDKYRLDHNTTKFLEREGITPEMLEQYIRLHPQRPASVPLPSLRPPSTSLQRTGSALNQP